MPVLLVSRQRVAVTADRAVVNEDLAPFVGFGIEQSHATALRRVGVYGGQRLRYHQRRRAMRQALQDGRRLSQPEQVADQHAHPLPAKSGGRPRESLGRGAAKIESYRTPQRRTIGAVGDRLNGSGSE